MRPLFYGRAKVWNPSRSKRQDLLEIFADMPNIPAICNRCATVFPSGFDLSMSGNTFSGCTWGPCPNCGSDGSIPDGFITVIGDVIRIVGAANTTAEQRRQLGIVLAHLEQTRPDPAVAVERITEAAPAWKGLGEFLSKYLVPKSAGDFWAVVGVLLAALQFLPSSSEKFDEQQVGVIVEHAVAAALKKTQPPVAAPTAAPSPKFKKKVGRNDPCPCASGKKFKRCCGSAASVSR